jgi:hypothetical protein
MNDTKKRYLIQTEDRYGRFSDYEVQANSKTEAEAIANKPENVVDGSIVISIEKLAPFHH